MTATETAEFTIDTSGEVWMDPAPLGNIIRWSDLDPFTQGYVEALFSDHICVPPSAVQGLAGQMAQPRAFSDLSPETLAAILKDCGRFLAMGLGENTHEHGLRFWAMRVRRQIGGGWHPDFPPLTPSLGDDGKVCLTERGA